MSKMKFQTGRCEMKEGLLGIKTDGCEDVYPRGRENYLQVRYKTNMYVYNIYLKYKYSYFKMLPGF